MVQECPGCRLVPQLVPPSEKGPVIVTPVMLRDTVPKSLSVVVRDVMHWQPALITFLHSNPKLVGNKVAFGPEITPVPLNATDCGLPPALSVIDNAPVRVPICVGLKVTLRVQFARGARLEPQVWVWMKSPLAVMLVMLSVIVPKLLSVADFPGLVVPTSWSAKVKLVGDKVAFGPETTPVPLKATVCGLPVALSVTLTAALRVPLAVGLNVTLILQLAPAAKELPQVWV
jgi:hypothetical protein